MELTVKPRAEWKARLRVPGDKSISHRALMLGGLGCGKSRVANLLPGDDCISTMRCMERLGVQFEELEQSSFVIEGRGLEGLQEPLDVLYAGNSGTTMRLLSGIVCGLPFFTCITGDRSLNQRPMKRIITPLSLMGAKIWGRQDNNCAPLCFQGAGIHGIDYTLPVASAQVKSAILLAALHSESPTRITEPEKTRDHTETMLRAMGVDVHVAGGEISLKKPEKLNPFSLKVPGDISSAAFLLGACAGLRRGELMVGDVGINPTRTGFLEILTKMGAAIDLENAREEIPGEPCADIHIGSAELKGITVEGDLIPRSIDELPMLAVLATQAEGTTTVRGARELRVKETDRIQALVTELGKLGAAIEEREDGFEVTGKTPLAGGRCKSHGDHRIAMALAVAGLFSQSGTIVEDAECISISFPEFETLLNSGEIHS